MKKLALLLMVLGAIVTSASAQEVKKEVKKEIKEEKKEVKNEIKEEKKELKEEKKEAKKLKQDEVPAVVVTKFNSLYPAVQDLEWEKEENDYKAEFKMNEVKTTVVFSAAGAVLKTKTRIKVTELPENAQTYLKNHPGDRIKDATKIVDGNGTVTYKAKGEDKYVFFDAAGNFISEKKD